MKKLIFICLTILFISLSVSKTALAEELYFNESGDLIFSVYDKIATNEIKYKTIGWVIKRYNDVLQADGQNSVNISKSGFIYQIPDQENPEYCYTTFIVDGDAIMDRISQASSEWRSQLEKYGGYVYLDSIMTVMEHGTDTGQIDNAGRLYGEVYYTYEGIRYARGWADGEKLRAYYDLMVQYPCFLTPLELTFVDTAREPHIYNSSVASSFKIGSSSLENEIFDVSKGIPSGEELYVYGTADKFRYSVSWEKVCGYAKIPVKITTVYQLRWYDTSGVYHVENQSVDRWYHVKRDYDFVQIKSAEKYDLTKAVLSSECFLQVEISGFEASKGCLKKQYGSSRQHVRINAVSEYYAGVKVVTSRNNQRPSIPDDNQQSIAESKVSQLTVWSDQLKINNVDMLSDKECIKSGKTLNTSLIVPKQIISRNQILIPKEKANKADYKSSVRLVYTADTKTSSIENSNINTVAVHTPVALQINVSTNKDNNENIMPSQSDLVIGDKFIMSFSTYGSHRDIQGYGARDYSKYVKKRYVKMEFPVIYGAKTYPEDTWIEIDSYAAVFRVPEYVREGEYRMQCRTLAVNIPSEYSDLGSISNICESGVNLNIRNYCAEDIFQVTIIGKLYGFTLENNNERYKSGIAAIFPEPVKCSEEMLPLRMDKIDSADNQFLFGLYANGIGDDEGEAVDIDVSYAVIDKDANGRMVRIPVDIYKAGQDDFTADTLIKMEEKINVSAAEAVKIRDGIYHFSYALNIPDKLIIVEKGKDISDISIKSDYIFYNKAFIVNLDIYGNDGENRKLSYENPENELQGYCNMWKKEGFSVDKFEEITLKCGDVLLIGMEGMMKNSSLIIGTH